MAKLILSLDDLVLQEVPLTKERTTIGRKPHNDIQIDNLAVSGEHAVIVTIMNDCILEDLGSTNGTLVNGVLATKHILQNNDVIELGKYKLKFLGMAATPAPTPADYEQTMVWRPPGAKPAAPPPAPSAVAPPIAPTPAPPPANPAVAPASVASKAAPPPPVPAKPAAAPAAAAPVSTAATEAHGGLRAQGVIRYLSGARAGRELKLLKPLTTLGKPGTQVAVVTRRPQGFFIAHVEGATPTLVNGRPISTTPHALKDRDTFELADVRMEFLLQDAASDESSNPLWKFGLVLLGIVLVGFVIYRMRG
jgi:pSer/pThr/pTyr-binding forkhead associated (FHA) protein